MKKIFAGFTALLIIFSQFPSASTPVAHASVSNWIKGSTVVPQSTTDFASQPFQQSLQNLKATGATYVALIVPYYQGNLYSTDIGPGWNTPTDAALGSGIDYAHSIGLAVTVIVHNESYSGDWRAYINPSDRNTWYTNFNNELQHVGTLAQAHHAEMLIMGTEMVSVASSYVNTDNTQRWQTLIANMRKIYTGKLTYDANSTSNNYNAFQDEKESIGFWGSLDYVGLSVYYGLNSGDNSVASLEAQWDYWNNNDLKGFQQRVNKPLLFSEIGYRSADNAHYAPWNSSGGAYNATEQANDYDALMGYWNNYPYVTGVLWWNWLSDPNGGGPGNTDYTVQNKPAQQVQTKWFTQGGGGTTPPPPSAPAITSSATVSPASPTANSAAAITATVKNTGGAISNGLVDVEVYNSANAKVYQQVFTGQNFASGGSSNLTANWPGGAAGTYHVAIGVFTNDWSQNYSWNGNAATINVQTASTPPPPPPSGTITTSATANPASPQSGATDAITATVNNGGSALSNALVDVEVYNSANSKVFQQAFSGQTLNTGVNYTFTANWTAGAQGTYHVAIGVFTNDWSHNYSWNGNAATINVSAASPPPGGGGTPPSSNAVTDIWWPTNGATVSGVQPFKAMVEGLDVSQYTMYWQVDGDALNQMGNSTVDYPHKEALVDLTGWNWSSNHQYTLNFVSKDSGGKVISQKSETIIIP